MDTLFEKSVLAAAHHVEDQLDNQLAQLDSLGGDDIEHLRKQRMLQLRKQAEEKQGWLARGHGDCVELQLEKEFFAAAKGEARMVCHFYRDNWPCKVMDKHMSNLARQHLETKFVKINAEKSPYLTDRLKIWMLPTLALVKHGKVTDYVVGFDDLGGKDDFSTEVLEQRLADLGLVYEDRIGGQRVQQDSQQHNQCNVRQSMLATGSDEGSDFD